MNLACISLTAPCLFYFLLHSIRKIDNNEQKQQVNTTRYTNPCYDQIEKIMNAMEVAQFKIQPLYKYVKEADECYEQADLEEKKRGKGGTLYHLNKYLDRKKFKKQK